MKPVPRLERERSLLLVVDVQERLAPHVAGHEALEARCHALLDAAAGLFNIPKRATEHCPAQIGPLVAPLRGRFADAEVFVKTRFGAADHEEFLKQLPAGRDQVVVAGMEAHVCVMQTALGLLAKGFEVFAVGEAIGSRAARAEDRRLALQRLHDAGACITGTETVLYEWARAGTDGAFKDVLRLVKGLPEG